ncbi:putative ribonuclease H-like domain-containing protein [Tanacetum coccineum]
MQRFASVKHPQANELVERANRSLGEGIKARLGEGNKNRIEELPCVLWAHRTMIKSSYGDTPFSLTYGTEAVILAEIGMPTYRTADKYVPEILKKFDFANVKTASTPIETQKPLVKDEEASDVDVHPYRFQVTPKTSHLSVVKRIFRYLKGKPKLGLWYPRVSSFDLESYSDSDYAGANLDRKSTIGAEYVAAASCCGQVLWIQNQMLDYGFNFMNTKIYIDNESTICIVKKPVYHSKTKHISIRHHFIRDAYEKKLIQVLKIHTDDNVADLLTKAFDVSSTPLTYIVHSLIGQSLLNLFKPISIAQFRTHSLSKPHSHLQALISTFTTISISSKMAVLDSCPKHNMVAYLEKSEGNEEFHDIIDFLKRSSIHFALTVSPIVSTTFVEQFWTSAKSKTINNVRHITAKVAGKFVSISEASIRRDLRFDDADGIYTLPNQAIFNAIQQMGYEGDLTVLTFNKALFSPQWRFLFHTINHCLSSKSTSWDQIPTNIATAVICLTSNQKYNFSKLIFDGMLRHLDAKKKFVMYPRFISIFLGKQLVDVSVPLDHFPVNTLTSKVFSFMVKKGKHFSGKVTPLFASMLVQPTQDEGASSERPSEALPTPSPAPTSEVPYEPQTDSSPAQTSEVPIEHQPNPSPRPSPTNTIPASIPETSGDNLGGHSSSDKSLSGNEGDMTIQGVYDLCLSLCKQVSDQAKEIQALKAQITKLKKQAKPVIKHHKAYLKSVSLKQRFPRKSFSQKHRVHKEYVSKQGRKFEKGEFPSVQLRSTDIDERMLSTEDVLSTDKEGVSTDFEKVSTDRPILSTDGSKVSTDRQIEGTEDQVEGAEDHVKGTDEHNEGTEDKNEGTEEIFEGIEELREGYAREEKCKKSGKLKRREIELLKKKLANEELIRDFDDMKARLRQIDSCEKLQEQESEQFTIEERAKFLQDQLLLSKKKILRSKKDQKPLGIKTTNKNQLERSDEDFISIGLPEDEKFDQRMNEKGVVMDKYQDEMPEGFDRVLWGDLMVLFNSDDKDEFWSSQLDWIIKYPFRKEVTVKQMLKLKLESEEENTMHWS